MKIHIDLPWGGTFDFERERRKPMDSDRFETVLFFVGVVVAITFFYLLLTAAIR